METKRAKVIMLPTEDKFSHISLLSKKPKYSSLGFTSLDGFKVNLNQHLYFITDDEIKKGDWFYVDGTDYTGQCIGFKNGNPIDKNAEHCDCKKIIATTDNSLLTKIPNVFSKWNLPKPSQEFIEEYCKAGGIDEVLVEYYTNTNNIWNHTLQDYDVEITNSTLKIDSYNTITIRPIKDSWTREEVIDLINKHTFEFDGKNRTIKELNEWENKNL